MFSGIACRRRRARWSRVGVLVSVGAVAALGALADAPLPAAGETGTPGGSSAASCPSPNPPNTLTLMAGTPQTAQIGTRLSRPACRSRWRTATAAR